MKTDVKLEDLIDVSLLQELQEKLDAIYSFPSAIIDNDGKVLTAVAWQDICTKFHRVHPECKKACIASDKYILDHLDEASPAVTYQCPHGLVDNAAPIVIDGKHMGNFFTGQFFLKEPDMSFFKEQAHRYGFNEKEYLEAVARVPVWPEEKVEKYLDFIQGFIQIIASFGLKSNREQEIAQRLKVASQSAQLGIWDWNVKENTMSWDARMYELYGVTEESFVKTLDAWLNGLHPEDKERAIAECNDALAGKTDFDTTFRVQHSDGNVLYIKADGMVLRDSAGEAIRMIGVNRDVTESKLNEIELQKTIEEAEDIKERFEYATSIGKVGTWDWNLITDELIWSSETYRILGHKPFSIQPSYGLFLDIVHPEDRDYLNRNVEEAWNEKKPYSVDCRIVLGNEIRMCNATGRVEYDQDDTPVRMVGTFQDVTDRKNIEKELILAKEAAEEANRLKTEFLNNMSHEIRTPMNGIMGFAQMLDKPDLSDEKRKYYSKIIQNSSLQLLRIIDDILEISTLETRQVRKIETEFSLNDLLMELFAIFSQKTKERNIPIYVKKALPDKQSYIISDRSKLVKILSNLLENSSKFTLDGFIELGYFIEHETLNIYVKDTGIGISPAKQRIIFERFSQEEKDISRKYGGLGLGLSISKENANILGGDITVESQKGEGSTFYVNIPYKTSATVDGRMENSEVHGHGDQHIYNILVAEDEEVNYLYLDVLFEDEIEGNYHLIHAKNGLEAVELCSSNDNIDLVLMDIKMPLMNGHEAAREIKKKFPGLPIIAQTAYSTVSERELALEYGCDDFISKPIGREEMSLLVEKYLLEKAALMPGTRNKYA